MRLRKRFRASAAISLGAILLLALLLGRSYLAAREAQATEDVARSLQKQILELAIVRDEYLFRREARARQQLEMKTDRIQGLLDRARATFQGLREVEILEGMDRSFQRGNALTAELVALPVPDGRGGAGWADDFDLEGRMRTEILRLAHELYSRADALGGSAAARVRATETQTGALAIALVALALAVTTANAFQSTRLVEERVERLRRGAERVAAGELDHRIAIAGDDELADLGRTFDAMVVRLQASYASLERSNRELEAFSYSVSHDLRAPLRHVTGFVGLLRAHAPQALDAKSQHYLDVISQAATRMGQLIDDLLTFSRMGRVEMKRGPVPLDALVGEVVRDLGPETAGREMVWDIAPLPVVEGDAAMLRQVWTNLIANAVKFSRTRTPARITIGARSGGPGEVHVFVRDNGVGFDMKYAAKLFQVFQRLHSSEEFEGTGIGLANVQRIVSRHGGRVWAEGVVDGGATFWMSLPVPGG